jgi:hypothetical protein
MRQVAPADLDPVDQALVLLDGGECVDQHGVVVAGDQGR